VSFQVPCFEVLCHVEITKVKVALGHKMVNFKLCLLVIMAEGKFKSEF